MKVMIIGGYRGSIKRLLLLAGLSFASCAVPALPEDYLRPVEEKLGHEKIELELLAANQNRIPTFNYAVPAPDN